MFRLLSNFSERVLNKLNAPAPCLLCHAPSTHTHLCAPCWSELPWLPSAICQCCAHPLPALGRCGRCLTTPPHFDQIAAACAYTYPLAPLIQSYKYHGRLATTRTLSAILREQSWPRPDLIVPVPLSAQRLQQRGFNQALELARDLSQHWETPIHKTLCLKIRDTTPQARLPWAARQRNIRGAFVVMEALQRQHVAIVDDVLTTGSTVNEIARLLKLAGAGRVTGHVIARALNSAQGTSSDLISSTNTAASTINNQAYSDSARAFTASSDHA